MRVPTQLASRRAPASPDFSGWNWVGAQRPVLHRGHERLAVLGPGDQRRAAGARIGVELPAAHAVGVHEVEPLPLHARRIASTRPGRPRCSSPCAAGSAPGSARRSPATPRTLRCARRARRRRSNRTCMPTQMPSTGRPPASRRPMTLGPCTAVSPAMHAANAPTPGTTRPSASKATSRVRADSDLGTRTGQGPLGRAQVARAVVQDHHAAARSPSASARS